MSEQNISPQKAKELKKIERELMEKYRKIAKQKKDDEEGKLKEYRPITDALEKVDETISDKLSRVDTNIKNVLEQNKTLITDLVPFTRQVADMDIPPSESETSFEKRLFETPAAKSTPYPLKKNVKFMDEQEVYSGDGDDLDTTASSIYEDAGIEYLKSRIIGPIGATYLPKITDKHYALKWCEEDNQFKLGNKKVDIENDDLIMDGKKYKGTVGLWRLLTQDSNGLFEGGINRLFSESDLMSYKEMLIKSSAFYQKNDPASNKPKAPQSRKYKRLVKKIYEDSKIGLVSGSGLIEYSNKSVMYINNLNELINRLSLIKAAEEAGNNNFHNEKLGVLKFISNLLEERLDDVKGTEYLIRIACSLPKSVLTDEKVGNGLLNEILNILPMPEMHWPGYNYLGPFTKLDKRLDRGDKPVNELDSAALEHDIFYRDHKSVKERHKADKILEHKAWERVKSKDSDLEEKVAAYVTTNVMKAKRHLGMGLDLENESMFF